MPVITPYQPMGLNQGQSVAFNASTSVNIGPFAGGIIDYVATANCFIAVGSATDAATVNGVIATFKIGYPGAILNTDIAAYTSTDNFTLARGSADDDAYNGCILVAHDVASAVQVQWGVIEDYTGSTKTVKP